MHDIFGWLIGGAKGQAIVGGAAGGLLRWLTLRSSWPDGLIAIIVGVICAAYLTPIANPLVTAIIGNVVLDDASRSGVSGLLIGIGGISITGLIMDYWAKRRSIHNDDSEE